MGSTMAVWARKLIEVRSEMLRTILLLSLGAYAGVGCAASEVEYQLGVGDIIRVTAFQNPDLSQEVRVSESGFITYPLIGRVELGGLAISVAEQKIAGLLKDGGFIHQAQISILVKQNIGNQVSVLGHVGRPGRYPLETFTTKLSDILANAGGVATSGSDVVILVGTRDGKPFRKEIDISGVFIKNQLADDILLRGGDEIYVDRAPMFYVYGEVQRPGSYRIEKNMTVMQALAQSGGPSMRGTQRGLKIFRRGVDGKTAEISPELTATVNADDVLYVRESLF